MKAPPAWFRAVLPSPPSGSRGDHSSQARTRPLHTKHDVRFPGWTFLDSLNERDSIRIRIMKEETRVVIDPQVQHGKPVIRGTRVTVARILNELAGGTAEEEVMVEYDLTREDIYAALSYAAELIETEQFRPFSLDWR